MGEKEKQTNEMIPVENYSIFREFWEFLKNSKKWWLLPIIIIMVLMSVFVALSTTSVVTPFIYAMF